MDKTNMDKIEVIHAGPEIVERPDCLRGRKNLDFGQGFYVTDIYDQAYKFAQSKARDRKKNSFINVYLLDRKTIIQKAKTLIFDSYDEAWHEFIVACRNGEQIWLEYDYIEGGVADDRVIDTVNMYIQGFISQERALKNLRYLKPNNQICILNQEMLDRNLKFTNSVTVPYDGLL